MGLGLALLVGEVLLIDDDLVAVLVHPIIAHHEVALVTDLVAPGIFNLPLGWLAVNNVNPGQHHRVVHHALTVIQRIGLGHVQIHVEEGVVVVGV